MKVKCGFTRNFLRGAVLTLLLTMMGVGGEGLPVQAAGALSSENGITSLPERLDKNCRKGNAKLYDECADQIALFDAALKLSVDQGKVLLVSYGAEWCIWCHVFEQHIQGKTSQFKYTFGYPDDPEARDTMTMYEREKRDVTSEARELNAYVSKSFVLVHIEGYASPNGYSVLQLTGADQEFDGGVPYIFSVTSSGRYVASMNHDRAETRRDGLFETYRGYDRRRLLEELNGLHSAALTGG